MKDEDMGMMHYLSLTWDLIRFRPLPFLLTIIFNGLMYFAPIAVTMVVREIFNSITGEPVYNYPVLAMIAIIPLLYLIRVMIGVGSMLAEFTFVMQLQTLMRSNMLDGVFRKPGSDSLPGSPGEAISRFRGDVSEVAFFTHFIAFMIGFLAFGIGATFILIDVSPSITAITYIPFLIIIFVVLIFKNRVRELRKVARKHAGIVTGTIAEVFNSVQAIKVSNAEANVFDYFEEINENRRKAVVKDRTFNRLLRSISESVSSYSTGILLLLIATLIQEGSFSVGDYILFTGFYGWISTVSIELGELLAWYQRARISYDRMFNIIKSEQDDVSYKFLTQHKEIYFNKEFPEITDTPLNGNVFRNMKIENLSYNYRDSVNGIQNINFEL
ncbi:MAG: ABC transporter ATP-binding protein [Candidatus Heimdallarchaeota archaeon]|nr:ABC transporter ATP-binding protein [Candidatus Heimdallarchaeota archaeon]